MKTNSLLAFIFTSIALIIILGLIGYLAYNCLTMFIYRDTEYCQNFSVDLYPEVSSVDLEIGKGKLVKVEITNNGFEDEFRVGTRGPRWTAARPKNIRLDQGETREIFLYLSPNIGTEGEYTLTLFVKSYCGMEETQIEITV
jgi:hypothetical protein